MGGSFSVGHRKNLTMTLPLGLFPPPDATSPPSNSPTPVVTPSSTTTPLPSSASAGSPLLLCVVDVRRLNVGARTVRLVLPLWLPWSWVGIENRIRRLWCLLGPLLPMWKIGTLMATW